MPDLLRLCTAGSVDDGKSTLIGRLLYEARGLYEDQIRSVTAASADRDAGPIDFSLFTDGLRAEREQGITIDVAYRYFSTPRRTFVLADTPGHDEYTRNMATGASTSDLAVILVDARHGLRPQTRRHARIARLFGISSFVLAVNKMDLVGFDRDVFNRIRAEFASVVDGAALHAIPLSALHGDNVIVRSTRMPWYDGPALLCCLEEVPCGTALPHLPFRMPVQLTLPGNGGLRADAGQIVSGTIHPGDAVTVWPSGLSSRIARIVAGESDLDRASAPMSIALTLDNGMTVERGDVIAQGAMSIGTRIDATILWMDERPLDAARRYLMKIGTRTVDARIEGDLSINEIAPAIVTASAPIACDAYAHNRRTGCFILIDAATGFTAAAGLVTIGEKSNPDST